VFNAGGVFDRELLFFPVCDKTKAAASDRVEWALAVVYMKERRIWHYHYGIFYGSARRFRVFRYLYCMHIASFGRGMADAAKWAVKRGEPQ
jgi:hypothetical protein